MAKCHTSTHLDFWMQRRGADYNGVVSARGTSEDRMTLMAKLSISVLTPFSPGIGRWRRNAQNANTNGATTSHPQCSIWERCGSSSPTIKPLTLPIPGWLLLDQPGPEELRVVRQAPLTAGDRAGRAWRCNEQVSKQTTKMWRKQKANPNLSGSSTCTCMSPRRSSGPTWRRSGFSSPSTCSTRRCRKKWYFLILSKMVDFQT